MTALASATWRAAIFGRWTARILGTLAALFFLALVFGEGPPNPLAFTWRQNLTFLGMISIFAGLVLAWFYEAWGGALTVAAFLAIGLYHLPALQIPTAIGALHILCGLRLRTTPVDLPPALPLSKTLLRILLSAGALFLLLCANEMFGNPPLMTPRLHPAPQLAGDWNSTEPLLAIRIHLDATITGSLTGKCYYNRSWFGRIMGWRTQYLIVGTESGEPIMAPFDFRYSMLTGALCHTHRKGLGSVDRLHLRRVQ